MANYTVTDTELTDIADAIIAKAGLSGQLEFPDDFVDGIEGISTGTDVSDTTAAASDVRTGKYFYTSAGVKTQGSLANGSATTPATTITANPSISVSNSGLITATNSKTQSVTPTVSAGYVSSGTAGTITVSGSNTSQLTTQAAQTITPTTSDQTIASGKYLTGTQTIKGDADLVAGNIKKDVQIFGVTGSYEGGGGATGIISFEGNFGETINVPANAQEALYNASYFELGTWEYQKRDYVALITGKAVLSNSQNTEISFILCNETQQVLIFGVAYESQTSTHLAQGKCVNLSIITSNNRVTQITTQQQTYSDSTSRSNIISGKYAITLIPTTLISFPQLLQFTISVPDYQMDLPAILSSSTNWAEVADDQDLEFLDQTGLTLTWDGAEYVDNQIGYYLSSDAEGNYPVGENDNIINGHTYYLLQ